MGDGVWGLVFGGSFEREGGRGGLFMDFYVLLTIGWGFLSPGGFFLLFSFFFSFREGRFVSLYFFSCFCPFLSFLLPFSASSLFLMKQDFHRPSHPKNQYD